MGASTDEAVRLGRDALERHAWDEAYETLSEADRSHLLPGDGLQLLAWAAYWTGRPDETIGALERAHGAYLEEGNRAEAAMMAFRVAEQHGMRMSMSQAQGWGARAQRLAEEDPDMPVHGWLTWMQGLMSWVRGDYEGAIPMYDRAMEIASRTGDRDLYGMSLHDKGHALCLQGRVAEGMPLLDEGMAAVVGGEMEPAAAGYVYCGMIGICSKLGDYRRSAEWTEATLRWCDRHSVPAFPGVCRVHKAELMRLRGSFETAEEEALAACEELPRFNFFSGLGPANYEIGEIRRQRGDFAAAEKAYARAHEYGHAPQPGLSLLRLAEGNADAAASGIRQALDAAEGNQCARVRLLAAQAEISLARGDVEAAASTSEGLDAIVGEFTATSLRAMAGCVRGAVRLRRGDAAGALPDLRRALREWQEVEAPLEAAEVRLLLAEAHAATGDREAAAMEARAARSTYERIGARPGAERAGGLLSELEGWEGRAERAGRVFMFTDIVRSTDLIGVIGDEAWEDLLRWHDQRLRSLFAEHGGDVGHHTGDGFFAAFADPEAAIRCAVAIQRALAEHRREHGFALAVRIGLHLGEATRRGQDYGGAEVHKAARIAALAEGGEILASEETVAEADGGFTVSDARDVELKGISRPVRIGRVDWR